MDNTRKKIRIGLFLFFIITLLVYGLFQSKNLLEGPTLNILEPQNGATLTYDLVKIRGVAKNIAYIKLNDRQIFVNNIGEFEEKLLVSPGYSIIKLSGQDKFGKIDEHFIHVYLPTSAVPALQNQNTTQTIPNIATSSNATSTATSTPSP